jgi:hypothetical protein
LKRATRDSICSGVKDFATAFLLLVSVALIVTQNDKVVMPREGGASGNHWRRGYWIARLRGR